MREQTKESPIDRGEVEVAGRCQVCGELGRVIEELHPSLLDHLGLATALQWYVDDTCRAANIECHVSIPALARMSPACRRALLMHRFDGLTYGAIAKCLGVSVSMVEKYISAALVDLRMSESRLALAVRAQA